MTRSNTGVILVGAIFCLLFGVVTWWVTDAAGGTTMDPHYSNTPNATVPGPPGTGPEKATHEGAGSHG
jgi:hypothetical protein